MDRGVRIRLGAIALHFFTSHSYHRTSIRRDEIVTPRYYKNGLKKQYFYLPDDILDFLLHENFKQHIFFIINASCKLAVISNSS